RLAAKARIRFLEPHAAAARHESNHGAEVDHLGIAEPRHQRRIERTRAREVVQRQEDMVHAAGRRARVSGGGTTTAALRFTRHDVTPRYAPGCCFCASAATFCTRWSGICS